MNNQDVVLHFFERLWNGRQLDIIDECFSEDAKICNPFNHKIGVMTMREVANKWLTAFPDIYAKVESVVTCSEDVMVRWQARGTHLGSFFSTQPTHQEVDYTGVTHCKVRDGKIYSYWALVDIHWILKQLQLSSLEEAID